MREVWLTARKAFTFGGTDYAAGQFFVAAPLVAVQMVRNRQAAYGKPKRIDAQPVMESTPEPAPAGGASGAQKTPTRRTARRVTLPADTRPEHPTVEALPPTPDAPAPNVTWKFEDY